MCKSVFTDHTDSVLLNRDNGMNAVYAKKCIISVSSIELDWIQV